MNYKECYTLGCQILLTAQVPDADWDARVLLEKVCQTSRNDLFAHPDKEVTPEQEKQYRDYLAIRSQRIPLQHILGEQEFMGLQFAVNENVLIPRQDTEILVEEVLKDLHDGMSILDLCTGSGCILISLLHYSNDCKGVGIDLSEKALQVARENADRILRSGSTNLDAFDANMETTKDISFFVSDLFSNVTGKFDRIVSNPPYIRTAVVEELMPEVRDHEPRMALDGMEDGLYFYKKIVAESSKFLNGGGKLYFEIGYDQAQDVSTLMKEHGFMDVQVVKDYAGNDRVVYGEKGY